jgi:hypothetical protein
MVTFDSELALKQFKRRKTVNAEKQQVDNSSLYAGSPMHYYCRFCGDETETLPENHVTAPKTSCDPCKVLRDHGLIDAKGDVAA